MPDGIVSVFIRLVKISGSVLIWRDVAGFAGRWRLICSFGFLLIFHVWILGKVLHTEVSFPTFDAREIAAKYLVLLIPEAIHINDSTEENKTCHSPSKYPPPCPITICDIPTV